MKRTKIRLLALLLATCILASPAGAATFYIEDVAAGNWAYPYASYMAWYDIMPLEDGQLFNPGAYTTRGEFVLFLWRAAGSPDIWSSSPSFTDVSYYDEYYEAVEWAVHQNITTGTSASEFSPGRLLTREQAFTFLWRALPFFGYSTEGYDGRYINGFNDAESVSQWAFQAMNGLFVLDIVNGDGGYLRPQRNVSNAETAAVLYRTLNLAGALEPGVPEENTIFFDIYNVSANAITAVYVMPAYTDGGGVDILPYALEPGDSYRVRLAPDFVFADSGTWVMRVVDEYGAVSDDSNLFNPKLIIYADIWGGYFGDEYSFSFEY